MRALPSLLAFLLTTFSPMRLHPQQTPPSQPHADPILYDTNTFLRGADSTTEVNTGPVTPEVLQQRLATGRRHVSLSTIYTFSYAHEGMYSKSDVDAVRARLPPATWQCSLDTRHFGPGEQKQRCVRQVTPEYYESVWIVTCPRSLTFVHAISAGSSSDPEP